MTPLRWRGLPLSIFHGLWSRKLRETLGDLGGQADVDQLSGSAGAWKSRCLSKVLASTVFGSLSIFLPRTTASKSNRPPPGPAFAIGLPCGIEPTGGLDDISRVMAPSSTMRPVRSAGLRNNGWRSTRPGRSFARTWRVGAGCPNVRLSQTGVRGAMSRMPRTEAGLGESAAPNRPGGWRIEKASKERGLHDLHSWLGKTRSDLVNRFASCRRKPAALGWRRSPVAARSMGPARSRCVRTADFGRLGGQSFAGGECVRWARFDELRAVSQGWMCRHARIQQTDPRVQHACEW